MSIVWWPIKTKIRTRSIRGSFLPFFLCPPGKTENTSAEDTQQTWKPRRVYKRIVVTVCGLLFSILIVIWFFPCTYYKETDHCKNGGTRVSCKGKLAQEIMKWQYENSVSPYPLPSTQEKIFPNVHGLLSFKDVISWTNIFLASCHVQLYLDYMTGYASFYFFVCGWNAHRAGVSERRPQTRTLAGGRGARDVDTRGGTKCIPPTSCLLTPVVQPTRWATLFTGSCFCARISLVDNQVLMPVSGWILPKPWAWANSPVFAIFLILSGKQSWSGLSHVRSPSNGLLVMSVSCGQKP